MTAFSSSHTNSRPSSWLNRQSREMLTPSILVVDDEKQIHSSLNLRLNGNYRLVCLSNPLEALALIGKQIFDLCIVDVCMPEMDGLAFIEKARELDPSLGYVVLSGFDSDENLRRAIPLQVLDFITKPLPNQTGFEKRIPEWVAYTRQRRHEILLTRESESIVHDLELARIEREVESTASESAREALLQTANLLTTIQALLLSANHALEPMQRPDPRLAMVFRSLQEARRHAETACSVSEGYFGSAYADRESSHAVIDACLRHATAISLRLAKADDRQQTIDLTPLGSNLTITGLTGIDFLLMIVPTLVQTLALASKGTTVTIRSEQLDRIDNLIGNARLRSYLWVNRRNATVSGPGVLLSIRASCSAVEEATAISWLRGSTADPLSISCRGLLYGIQKTKGLLALAVGPKPQKFEIILALPV